MCDTCVARDAITASRSAKSLFVDWLGDSRHPHVPKGAGIFLDVREAKRKKLHPEGPAEFRIRRERGRWSAWRSARDLAAVCAAFGMDTPWPYVAIEVRRWLKREGPFPRLTMAGARGDTGLADRLHRRFTNGTVRRWAKAAKKGRRK